MNIRHRLRDVAIFESLPNDAIETLVAVCDALAFSEGATIYKIDDPGDSLFMLIGGSVVLERPGRKPSRSHRIAAVSPTTIFGELSIFDAHPRSFNAVATSDVELLRLPHEAVVTCLQDHPQSALTLLTQLAERLRDAHIEIAQLKRPHSRAAHNLFDKLNEL